jgi:hypothetical protein
MASRPPFLPTIDLSASNVDFNYPNNPLNQTGFATDVVIPSKEHNTLWLVGSLWLAYFDYNTLHTADNIDLTTSQQWSTDRLAYTVGDNVLAVGAAVDTYPTYMFDGWRVQVDAIMLSTVGAGPLLVPFATAPGRIWIYVDVSLVDGPPPLQPIGTIRVESVAAGDPETPNAGELALCGVDIDATGFVTGNSYPASEPEAVLIYNTLKQRWLGPTEFEDAASFVVPFGNAVYIEGGNGVGSPALSVSGGAGLAADLQNASLTEPSLQLANVLGGPALSANGDVDIVGSTTCEDLTADSAHIVGGVAATSLQVDAAVGFPSISVTSNNSVLSAQSAIVIDAGSGRGLYMTAASAAVCVDLNNSGAGSCCAITTTGSGSGLRIDVTGGSGTAITALGSTGSATTTIAATAGHASASTITGTTNASALVTSYGVRGIGGSSSGSGINGQATGDGYGVVAQSDTTSPIRAALRLVPQNADASSPVQGDVELNSARSSTGKLRVYTTQWESIHSTAKGLIFDWGVVASGALAGGGVSANLSLAQFTPEETGDVLVMVTGSLTWTTDLASATIDVYDVTSGVIVATQTERAIDTDVSATPPNNTRSFVIRGIRTLPSTATRTFAVVITATTQACSYTNVILSVQGVK